MKVFLGLHNTQSHSSVSYLNRQVDVEKFLSLNKKGAPEGTPFRIRLNELINELKRQCRR